MRRLTATLLFFCSANIFAATTTTWSGSISNDYSDPMNWDNGVPGVSDTAVIAGPFTNFPIVTGTLTVADLQVSNGQLQVSGSSSLTVTNSATIDPGASLTGGGTLILSGNTSVDAGGGETVISCIMNNQGTLTINNGAFRMTNNNFNSGTIDAANGMLRAANSSQFDSTGNITGTFDMIGTTLFLNGNGTQVGPLTIIISSDCFVRGTGSPNIGAGGSLDIVPTATGNQFVFNAGTFVCDGTINLKPTASRNVGILLQGGNLTINGTLHTESNGANGTYIGSNNTLTISASGALIVANTLAEHSIGCPTTNDGLIQTLGGILHVSSSVTNSGTIDTSFPGSEFKHDNSSSLTSTGLVKGTLRMVGTTLVLDGVNTQNDTLDILLNFDSFINGSNGANLAPSGVINVQPTGASQLVFNAGTFVSNGTINLQPSVSTGVGLLLQGGNLTVNGFLNTVSNGSIGTFVNGGQMLTIGPAGTLSVSNAGTEHSANSPITNNGTIVVNSGKINGTSNVTNAGTIDTSTPGTEYLLSNSAIMNSTGLVKGNLRLNGTTLNLNGNGTQNDTLNIFLQVDSTLGGTGSPQIASTGVINLSPAGASQLVINGSIVCDGTINLNASASAAVGLLFFGSSLTINGALTCNANSGNGTFAANSGSMTLGPAATMTVNASGAQHSQNVNLLNNGSIDVITGTLQTTGVLTSNGSIIAQAGADLLCSGGNKTFNGPVNGKLRSNGVTMALNGGNQQTGDLTIEITNDSFLTTTANPSLPSGATMKITTAGPGTQLFFNSAFTNDGEIDVDATAAFVMNLVAATPFTNNGTIRLNGVNVNTANVSGSGPLNNSASGTIENNAATNANSVPNSTSNTGTINANSGVLNLPGTFSNDGALVLNGGDFKVGNGSNTMTLTAGSLSGAGTVQGSVNNTGATIYAGGPIGPLNITGSYGQDITATLEVEIGGATPATQFDQLIIGGSATIAGGLNVKLANGYVPPPATTFTPVMSFASQSGDFDFVDSLDGASGAYFLHSFSATALSLQSRTVPVTVDANVSTPKDTPYTGTLVASDADGDSFTYYIDSPPSNGMVTITDSSTGAFTYTPNAGFVGTETIVFNATDGVFPSQPGTVIIRVANAPVISAIDASQNPTRAGLSVTFTVTAVDTNILPLSYSWDFGDSTPIQTGQTVTHAFSTEAIFTVTVTASNGLVSASSTLQFEVLAANSGAGGVPNISTGDPAVENPLNGMTIMVLSSDGGVIELLVDVDALNRAAFNVSTTFDTIQGRVATRTGTRPVAKIRRRGIVVTTSTAIDAGTGVESGKARKMIPVSRAETAEPPLFTTPPVDRELKFKSVKGKFIFSGSKSDAVIFQGSVELPEGLDLSQPQEFSFGIGNVIDEIMLDAKGRLTGAGTAGFIKKAKIGYPRLKKGQTLTPAGTFAKISLQIVGAGLSNAGFDTEGITATLRDSETVMKSVPREIQAALVLGGASYEAMLPVQYKLSPKGDAGAITGRGARAK